MTAADAAADAIAIDSTNTSTNTNASASDDVEIESDRLRLVFERSTGELTTIEDKLTGTQACEMGLQVLASTMKINFCCTGLSTNHWHFHGLWR